MTERRPAPTIAQLWAVAALTLKEAVRRRVFLVLIIFAVAVMSSMTFFSSVDPVSKLRLVEIWSLRATIFFGALTSIFLGAYSLPGDYEAKRIHVIASKPISKITFLLGKYVGLALMLAVFLGVMGLISLAFLRMVKLSGGSAMPELRARPQTKADTFEGFGLVRKHPLKEGVLRTTHLDAGILVWEFRNLKPGEDRKTVPFHGRVTVRSRPPNQSKGGRIQIVLLNSFRRSHALKLGVRDGESFTFSCPLGFLTGSESLQVQIFAGEGDISVEANRNSITLEGKDGSRIPAASFKGLGQTETSPERPGIIAVDGWATGTLGWQFQDLDSSDYPDPVTGRIRVTIFGVRSRIRFTGNVKLVMKSGSQRHEQEIFCKSSEWAPITFPRKLLDEKEPLLVYIVPGDADMRLSAEKGSFRLFERDELFEWNYLKGLFLIYAWLLIIMTVTVVSSSFLSGPMSVLMGIILMAVGSIYGFSQKAVKDVDHSLERYYEAEERGEEGRTPEDLPTWLLEYSRYGSKAVLFIFPNADQFDFSEYLVNDLAVSGSDLADAALEMLPRILLALLLGIIVMARKDFG